MGATGWCSRYLSNELILIKNGDVSAILLLSSILVWIIESWFRVEFLYLLYTELSV